MTDVKTIDRALPGVGYAGDVSPLQAWAVLNEQPHVVDVRSTTQSRSCGRLTSPISTMNLCSSTGKCFHMNGRLTNVTELADLELQPEQVLLFICRSGVRSRLAAR